MDMQYIFVRHDEKRTHYRVCDRRDPVGRRAAPSTPRAHGVDESVYWSLTGHWSVLTFWQSQKKFGG
jgi:hypothetical protein